MKRLVFVLSFTWILFTACASKPKEEAQTAAVNNTGNTLVVEQLDKAGFLKKVADYEQNSKEWKYLGEKPCIIDFYADWCGPCKTMGPILEKVAGEYGDSIIVYKVNVDEQQELAATFGIRSIPTLLFVPMKDKPQMSVGLLPETQLRSAVESVIFGR